MKRIYNFISIIGHPFAEFILHLGSITHLFNQILFALVYPFTHFNLIIKEIYFSGVRSIIIITISGWFVGMVLGLQGYNVLQRFGSTSMVGSMVALSILRELGPVLTAILFAARAGSGMTAEIGLMKATEQIDAMEVMAVSPIKRIIAPKFIGGIVAVPLLAGLFATAGIMGGYFVSVIILKIDSGTFWSQMQSTVNFHDDVINGIIKSFIFGIAVTLIAVYQGFISKPTAQGVASATTTTVVSSALIVLALDFILTSFMF